MRFKKLTYLFFLLFILVCLILNRSFFFYNSFRFLSSDSFRLIRDNNAQKEAVFNAIREQAEKGTFGEFKEEILENVEKWMDEEVYGDAWKEIAKLVNSENWNEIADAFYTDAKFGTAGIRGKTGVGPNRINMVTVKRVAQAVADNLKERFDSDTLGQKPYIVSYDTRENSEKFAKESASILAANGIKVEIVPSDRTIGWFSYVIPQEEALGGLMITASHNPVGNNGIKLSDYYGGQLLPETGQPISDNYPDVDLSEVKRLDYQQAMQDGLIEEISTGADDEYIEGIINLSKDNRLASGDRKSTKIVYDALYGTARWLTPEVLKNLGYDITEVEEHSILDPQFTGLEAPNPTHPGALDLARQTAAIKQGYHGEWQQLTGNEQWVLVTEYLLSRMQEAGIELRGKKIVRSWGTTSLIDKVAEKFGVEVIVTPVGFKYIGALMEEDASIIAGFEESNGMTLSAHSREKDGILAAGLMTEAITWWDKKLEPNDKSLTIFSNDADGDRLVIETTANSIVLQQLENVKETYGLIENSVYSIPFGGPDGMSQRDRIVADLIKNPPAEIGTNEWTFEVKKVQTEINGVNDGIKIFLKGGDSVLIRKSGTEPKLRIYTEVTSEVSIGDAQGRLSYLNRIVREWFQNLRQKLDD